MEVTIRNRPDYATVHLVLDTGEQVVTEPGVMMGMDPALKLESSLKGGLMAAAKRALVGESLVLTTWTATGDGQRLDLAPGPPGDVVGIELDGGSIVLQKGAFLAATTGISLDVKWAGAKGFLSGESLLMIRATGVGQLFACSYGAIEQVDVNGSYEVDTTHVVAFDEGLTWDVVRVGGLKSTLLSQEGLVVRFGGQGRVWFQTRSAPNLASFLHPFRPVQPRRS
ncbi:MAG: TIGR00266 family protein [Myxococcales bacterium]|nr:TIGR00266 family protein [Myxococcales bacterium]MCA9569782.1 TIGR00266 family protein [Myxococcales bacterium]